MTRRRARGLLACLAVAWLGGCSAQRAVEPVRAPLPTAPSPALDIAAQAHPVVFLDRVGWGADAAQLRELRRIGATRWLDAQLQPTAPPRLPPAVARALPAGTPEAPLQDWVPALLARQRSVRRSAGDAAAQAQRKLLHAQLDALTRDAQTRQLLLDVYASNQLQQRLVWFWMNHFNVFRAGLVGPMLGDYAQRVIAPHALGRFSELLRATMFSPQMLLYLNNAQNARNHVNENYARELMERHTLGVGAGYSQADVTALAHVLTGLGVDLANRPVRVRPALRPLVWRDGLVVFNPARHDPRAEVVRGHTLQGRGVGEIEQVVKLLADDPATARHVSFELAQYFVADQPDPALVDAMVRSWRHSDGDIAVVLHTLFTSTQFVASLNEPQFKDPMRYLLSALRAGIGERTIGNPKPLLGMLAQLGEPLDGCSTPNGYPIAGGAWDAPGQLSTRFRLAARLGAGAPALFIGATSHGPGAAGSWRRRARAAVPALSTGAVFLAAAPTLRPATAQALTQVRRRRRWNALWLASPDFMND
jgi:uncharacterized protein (DUF1800 family)